MLYLCAHVYLAMYACVHVCARVKVLVNAFLGQIVSRVQKYADNVIKVCRRARLCGMTVASKLIVNIMYVCVHHAGFCTH